MHKNTSSCTNQPYYEFNEKSLSGLKLTFLYKYMFENLIICQLFSICNSFYRSKTNVQYKDLSFVALPLVSKSTGHSKHCAYFIQILESSCFVYSLAVKILAYLCGLPN